MSRVKSAAYGTAFGLLFIIIITCIGAAAYMKYDYDYSYVSLIMQAAYVFGSFLGAFICAKLFGKNGIVSGLITSAVLIVICFGLSMLFGDRVITLPLILTLVIMLGAGLCGGVLSLNVGKNKTV